MNIRERRAIHQTAAHALSRASQARQIAIVYAAICVGLSLLSTVISVLLSDKIAGTGGLGNIGIRSVLSTGQSVLPLVNFIINACLTIGYHIAILSFTRGFDASPRTLSQGFRYWGVILRTLLFQVFIYVGTLFVAMYLSSFIFMSTSYAEPFVTAMEPYLSSLTVLSDSLVLDEELLTVAMDTLMPMMWILAAVALVLMLPLYYRFRMVNYALADDPQRGAIHAVVKSRHLMRRNCFALFRLDLTLWWFYAAQLGISLVCYGDVLLPMLGVELPVPETVAFFGFYLLYMAASFCVHYFLRNKAEVSYALAYDAVKPEEKQSGGVVLGNIFQM